MLRINQVLAKNSSKWGDPWAKPLAGEAWQQAKPTVPASLNLPGEAGSIRRRGPRWWTAPTGRSWPGPGSGQPQIVFDDGGR